MGYESGERGLWVRWVDIGGGIIIIIIFVFLLFKGGWGYGVVVGPTVVLWFLACLWGLTFSLCVLPSFFCMFWLYLVISIPSLSILSLAIFVVLLLNIFNSSGIYSFYIFITLIKRKRKHWPFFTYPNHPFSSSRNLPTYIYLLITLINRKNKTMSFLHIPQPSLFLSHYSYIL